MKKLSFSYCSRLVASFLGSNMAINYDKLDKTNLYTISQWIGLREQNIGAPPIFHGHFSVFPLDILDLLNICVGEKW